jgi:hypothetical protein
MASYTVHIKRRLAETQAAQETAVFVRDGWSWAAFGFGPFWILAKRHVLVGLLALVLQFGTLATLAVLGARPEAVLGISVLFGLLWGHEGASLRRLALRLRRYDEVALVVATAEDEAERRYFVDIATGPEPIPAAPAGSFVPHGASNPVMGLFPQARGSA